MMNEIRTRFELRFGRDKLDTVVAKWIDQLQENGVNVSEAVKHLIYRQATGVWPDGRSGRDDAPMPRPIETDDNDSIADALRGFDD